MVSSVEEIKYKSKHILVLVLDKTLSFYEKPVKWEIILR